MRASRLHEGDVVEVNVRGRVFEAELIDLHPPDWSPEWVEVEAIHHGSRGYRFVTKRQIKKRLRPARIPRRDHGSPKERQDRGRPQPSSQAEPARPPPAAA